MSILGVGTLSIVDVSDAIITSDGHPPRGAAEGALWIDTSIGKQILKVYENGSWSKQELDVESLDPALAETIKGIMNNLGSIADDGVLSFSDRIILSQEVSEIVGVLVSKTTGNVYPSTLPDYLVLDSSATGSFANLRLTATNVGMVTTKSEYVALEKAYTALNTYLSQFSPKPWDVSETNKEKITTLPDPDMYRQKLLDYYMAELSLATATEKQAKASAEAYTDTVNSESFLNLTQETLPALKDGILNKSEKASIKQTFNIVQADKTGMDSQYTTIYNNTKLLGTPKTNLASAQTAYTTAFNSLRTAITAVLNTTDNATIPQSLIANVDTGFVSYGDALALVKKRMEEAIDAISGKKVDEVDKELGLVSERVSTAEEKITDDAIVQTVTQSTTYTNAMGEVVRKDNIISSINQTAETIAIAAENINFNGKITINAFAPDAKKALDEKATKAELEAIELTPGPIGATGAIGPRGAEGTSVDSITEYYLATSSSSGVATGTSGWTTTLQTISATKKYLWNYEKTNFSDGTSQNTIPVIMGAYGDQGPQGNTGGTGSTGATGRSITDITEYYLASSSSTGVTRSTTGWATSMQQTTTTNKYLWNYEKLTWSSGTTTTYVEPIIIGVHGETGAKGDTGSRGLQGLQGPQGNQGIPGAKGADGKSQYTHIAYADTASGGGFDPLNSVNKAYIGMYVDNTSGSSSDPTKYKWTLVKGSNGSQGIQGPKGTDGETSYFHTAYANSADGSSGFSTTDSDDKLYIGTLTNFLEDDSTNPPDYAWTRIKGENATFEDKTEILSDNPIFTDKSDDAVVHVGVDGKSEQNAGSGKNLSPVSNFDGTLLSSKAIDRVIIHNIPIDPLKSYVFSFKSNITAPLFKVIVSTEKANETNNGHNGTFSDTVLVRKVGVEINSGVATPTGYSYATLTTGGGSFPVGNVGDIVKITEIQLEQGSVVTPYEPPAPSPDYPIPINSLNNVDVVSSVGGKELLSKDILLRGRYVLETTGALLITPQHSAVYKHPIKSNQLYTIFADPSKSRSDGLSAFHYLRIVYHDAQGNYISGSLNLNTAGGNAYTFKTPNNAYLVSLSSTNQSYAGHGGSNETTWHLVEGGNSNYWKAPEDIPYDTKSPTLYKTNILLSEPLRSVGDVHDRVFLDSLDNLWKVERNIGEYKITGNEGYTVQARTNTVLFNSTTGVGIKGLGSDSMALLSTHFKPNIIYAKDEEGVYFNPTGLFRVSINQSRLTANTVVALKTWLTVNDVKIQYELATPTIETLSAEQQTKLNNIQSFKGSNYVYTVLPDKSGVLSEQLTPTLHAKFKSEAWNKNRLANLAIDTKVDSEVYEDNNATTTEQLAGINESLTGKVDSIDWNTRQSEYDDFLTTVDGDLKEAEKTLITLDESVDGMTTKLDEHSASWETLNGYIKIDGTTNTFSISEGNIDMVLGANALTFYSGGVPVARITDQYLQIDRGIFTQSAQIGQHKFEPLTGDSNSFVLNWVGEE